MSVRSFAFALIFALLVHTSLPAATPCPTRPPRSERSLFDVGLGLINLLPSDLADFRYPVLGYGPRLGIALPFSFWSLSPSFYADASYATDKAFTLWLIDAGMRMGFSLPFFDGFLMLGGHRLEYSHEGRSYGYWGTNFGWGLIAAMGDELELNVAMKGYLQAKPMLSFGFGFSYLF